MNYYKTSFQRKFIIIRDTKLNYYVSPLLSRFHFIHAFFTKNSHEFSLELLTNVLNLKNINYSLNQIHSNNLILGSKLHPNIKSKADGIVSDKACQSLWVYTADCLPILFADKRTRRVAAIHCGRLGLEKKIIKRSINFLQELGSMRKELLVAIGPSISKINYLLDIDYIRGFYKNISLNESEQLIDNMYKDYNHISDLPKKKTLLPLDLQENAFKQLSCERIPCENIEISEQCTYELSDEFHSWRRARTRKRQWSFICS